MLSSSGTLIDLIPPVLSNAIFITPTDGCEAPSELDAFEEKLLKWAKYRSFSSS